MNMQLAAQLNSLLAALILLTAFAMLAQRKKLAILHLFAWQGFFLSLSTAIVGFVAKSHHLYISSLLTLTLKVILLPYILHVLMRKLKIRKEVETVVNVPATMLMGIVLVIFSYNLTAPIRELINAAPNALPASPFLAIAWPSKIVAAALPSPGTPKRTEVISPVVAVTECIPKRKAKAATGVMS